MNDLTNDTTSRKRAGGQPGNTNGQRHGLFSTQAPPTVQALRALADAAIEEGDVALLTRIERAAKFHAAHSTEPHTATAYRQAEHMIRAARAMLDYDQRKEDRYEERSDHAMSGGGADDWPPVDPPFTDNDLQEINPDDWITTYHPIHDQPPLLDLPDAPPVQTSIFTGDCAARGLRPHRPGGQDEFPHGAGRRH